MLLLIIPKMQISPLTMQASDNENVNFSVSREMHMFCFWALHLTCKWSQLGIA